jgi:hypothetical protein
MLRVGRQPRLMNASCVLSLCLSVLAIAMGVISIWYEGDVIWVRRGLTLRLDSGSGMIGLRFWHPDPGDQPRCVAGFWRVPTFPHPGEFNFRTLGFAILINVPNVGWTAGGNPIRVVAVPYWAIAVIGAIGPSWRWIGAYKRRRRQRQGRCIRCNYDLRATPHRCPECGLETSHAATPAAGRAPSDQTQARSQ